MERSYSIEKDKGCPFLPSEVAYQQREQCARVYGPRLHDYKHHRPKVAVIGDVCAEAVHSPYPYSDQR